MQRLISDHKCADNADRLNAIDSDPLARLVRSSSAPAFMVIPLSKLRSKGAESRPDAIPKKRGPKTDVLEALLKRVDGLERRLRDEKEPTSLVDVAGSSVKPADTSPVEKAVPRPKLETAVAIGQAVFSPITPRCGSTTNLECISINFVQRTSVPRPS